MGGGVCCVHSIEICTQCTIWRLHWRKYRRMYFRVNNSQAIAGNGVVNNASDCHVRTVRVLMVASVML
jgi:hypothetical protein